MGFLREEDEVVRRALFDDQAVRLISVEEFFVRLKEQSDQLAMSLIGKWREGYVSNRGFDRSVEVPFLPATIVVDESGRITHRPYDEPLKEVARGMLREAINRILPDAEPYKVFLEPNTVRTVHDEHADGAGRPRVTYFGYIKARLYVYL